MGNDLVPNGMVVAFLVVFARAGATLMFLPLPGFRMGPTAARSLFAFCFAVALFPNAPHSVAVSDTWQLAGMLMTEAALGIAMGLIMTCATEALLVGMQIVSLQAGYSYASTIDPTTEAESGVLVTLAQMASGLLFFSLGLDRMVLGAFARSLQTIPPGSYRVSQAALDTVIHAGSTMISNGLLAVAPVIALVLMADIALAVAGRLHSQLQMMGLSFPVKMLMALALLGWTMMLLPGIYRRWMGEVAVDIERLLR